MPVRKYRHVADMPSRPGDRATRQDVVEAGDRVGEARESPDGIARQLLHEPGSADLEDAERALEEDDEEDEREGDDPRVPDREARLAAPDADDLRSEEEEEVVDAEDDVLDSELNVAERPRGDGRDGPERD